MHIKNLISFSKFYSTHSVWLKNEKYRKTLVQFKTPQFHEYCANTPKHDARTLKGLPCTHTKKLSLYLNTHQRK